MPSEGCGREDVQGIRSMKLEDRVALHGPLESIQLPIEVDGKDVMPEVNGGTGSDEKFSNRSSQGMEGVTGKLIADIVNIGIGGSTWGPW
jgi:glucose-6-phosphate isomerase